MRITIVTGAFFPLPPGPGGAIERLWYDLGLEFAARGHQVSFVCRGYAAQKSDETCAHVRFFRRGGFARTGRIHVDLVKDLLYSLRILPVLPAADIVVMNVFWLPPLAAVLRPVAGKVVINVARVPKGQMWLYRRCARLAAVSNAIRDAIAAECPNVLPITRVVPNPINTDIFTPPPGGRDFSGERTILYTGRVHAEKGLHLLIDAFARLYPRDRRLRLRIVGPARVDLGGGGDDYIADLRRRSEGLPVMLCDPIYERTALAEAHRKAHYYCYPSLADKGESFGVAPLEAMATGMAPVVSNLDCFRDFIEDDTTGIYFDHHSPDAVQRLAAALGKLTADPGLAMRLGEAATRRAQDFSYPAVAQQYLADFEAVLGTSSSARERK